MSDTFAFEGSWGAFPVGDGRARFRLWAPGQPAIFLVADAAGTTHEMTRLDDGWFELVTDAVPAGSGYRFELADRMRVPDPASREQIGDVHGPSRLVDPHAYRWRVPDWQGRPWSEAVIYELHTGTFSGEGTFRGVEAKLDHLVDTGFTAVELLPVAQFAGERGWGYDGVLPYAPHAVYGGADGLKSLVDAAHERGLMILLDVVYNHFGPDGNYLHLYAPQFFNTKRHTPWGAAIDYTRRPVRDFAIQNALYWLEEYRFDGLRLDAIDQIDDPTSPSVLHELGAQVRAAFPGRHIHLTTEDARNITELHEREPDGRPRLYTAEWNDDFHHAAHVLATGEADGYYLDYQDNPPAQLARALATGYIYQGQSSPFLDGAPRGEPSAHLPPVAFVNFLQNHDQAGNRAFGERLSVLAEDRVVEALTAILLLSPPIPLLFMGEEWGERRPFFFFTDFHGELGDAVREGRRNEFRKWQSFQDETLRANIPDPNATETFAASRLDWDMANGAGQRRLGYVKNLLGLRQRELAPRLEGIEGNSAIAQKFEGPAVHVAWRLGDGSVYGLVANLSAEAQDLPSLMRPEPETASKDAVRVVHETPDGAAALETGRLLPWSVVFYLAETPSGTLRR